MSRCVRPIRGALLLETIVALSIFVMSSLAVTGVLSDTIGSLERTRDRAVACDLACSVMAQIETGLADAAAIDGPIEWPRQISDGEPEYGVGDPNIAGWLVEIESEPAGDLTLMTVHAYRAVDEIAIGSPVYTLRRMVRLGRAGEDEVGEDGELLEAAERGAAGSGRGG